MTINKNFMLKQVGDSYMVIPVLNNNVSMSSIFDLNETGYFIYQKVEEGLNKEAIAQALTKEYKGIDYKDALKDVEEYISILLEKGIIND